MNIEEIIEDLKIMKIIEDLMKDVMKDVVEVEIENMKVIVKDTKLFL
jgi:hypothetical protein